MPITAAVYVRISDDREGGGLGVERQEKDCREQAARLGWRIGEVYTDNDLTAFAGSRRTKPRPSYDRMLADLRARRWDGVIAWHTDRLHRNSRELDDFIDVCEEAAVPVETVQAGVVDLRTPAGRAVARTLCAWAMYESEHKSERIKAKYRQLAEAGEVGNGGHRPFGYERDRRSVRESEATVLRGLYAHVLAGRSLRSLCRELHEQGVTTTTGRKWSLQGLRYNLVSPRNTGLREHRGVIVSEAVWPAIVDRDTWTQVRAILLDESRYTGDHDGARRYVLTGFLRCGLCGHKLRPAREAQQQRFACKKDAGGCGSIVVSYKAAEEHVVDLVLDRLADEVDLQAAPNEGEQAQELLRRLDREETDLRALVDAYRDAAERNPLELRLAGAVHRDEIDRIKAELAGLVTEPRLANPRQVRSDWLGGTYDLEQKRAVLGVLVERIDVAPGVRGRNYFDPERLSITWR